MPVIKVAVMEGSGGYLPWLLQLLHPGTSLEAPESSFQHCAHSGSVPLSSVQVHSCLAGWESE